MVCGSIGIACFTP
ncbi:DUF3265 domain-containing protein [Vibrio alginolyticus]|nr:DUF3265 domain-containing protein [Vibrio alginolyticus]